MTNQKDQKKNRPARRAEAALEVLSLALIGIGTTALIAQVFEAVVKGVIQP